MKGLHFYIIDAVNHCVGLVPFCGNVDDGVFLVIDTASGEEVCEWDNGDIDPVRDDDGNTMSFTHYLGEFLKFILLYYIFASNIRTIEYYSKKVLANKYEFIDGDIGLIEKSKSPAKRTFK